MSLAFCISPPFPHRSTRPRYAQKPFNVVSSIQLILLSTESDQVGTILGTRTLPHTFHGKGRYAHSFADQEQGSSFIYLFNIYLFAERGKWLWKTKQQPSKAFLVNTGDSHTFSFYQKLKETCKAFKFFCLTSFIILWPLYCPPYLTFSQIKGLPPLSARVLHFPGSAWPVRGAPEANWGPGSPKTSPSPL